ncbi:MAG: phosphoribosyltransferase family protein [Cytophagales bacterium]|nr:phosphoribosyltransferase family protein [Bernardetiaceae bacterium]MDW8210301.1 phosphoribosyltransferase family protein [Cytophagales bacterium]
MELAAKGHIILRHWQIVQKIRRIAFEICERNFGENEIIIAGIAPQGYLFAQLLTEELQKILPIQWKLAKIQLDKQQPATSPVTLNVPAEIFYGKTIILTDDVLYTGRTFCFAIRSLLEMQPKKLQTAVIVDRGHQQFPIAADYVGYALSTTVRQHVEVHLENPSEMAVYLR